MMLERITNMTAGGLMWIANRLASQDRDPDQQRVSGSGRTMAGINITPDTAVTVPVVWACLRYLSQTVAVLPWHVMKDGDLGAEIQRYHPVEWMLWKRPSSEWSSFQFRETLTHWALRWGNGYAEIEPDTIGRPQALWPIHPERVEVCRAIDASADAYGDPIPAGGLFYEINNGAAGKTVLSPRRMFHVRGFGEGPVGVNVINYAAQSIGWARASQLFGASFFGNGMNLGGVVMNKKPLKPEGLARQKAEFDALYRGPMRAHRWAHLDNDAEIKQVGIEPQKAQMVELNQFLVEEVCRWFGVPPHKVMHLLRSTFNNIEHQAIEVVVDSVSPWAKRFEDEADYKLFGPQNRQGLYTKMNMNALLRGDSKARAEFYRSMFDMGAYSPNRILELEDENTLGPEGDKHLVQLNLTTLERAGEQPETPQPAQPSNGDDMTEDDAAMAARLAFNRAMEPVNG